MKENWNTPENKVQWSKQQELLSDKKWPSERSWLQLDTIKCIVYFFKLETWFFFVSGKICIRSADDPVLSNYKNLQPKKSIKGIWLGCFFQGILIPQKQRKLIECQEWNNIKSLQPWFEEMYKKFHRLLPKRFVWITLCREFKKKLGSINFSKRQKYRLA